MISFLENSFSLAMTYYAGVLCGPFCGLPLPHLQRPPGAVRTLQHLCPRLCHGRDWPFMHILLCLRPHPNHSAPPTCRSFPPQHLRSSRNNAVLCLLFDAPFLPLPLLQPLGFDVVP